MTKREDLRRPLLIALGLLLELSEVRAQAPELSALSAQQSITQYGITWTFSAPVPTGRFVNGDYYVIGPATVTAITPAFADGRNGSMINPRFARLQGYDARIQWYSDAAVARPPFTLKPGDALVSAIGHDDHGPHDDVCTQFPPHAQSLSRLRTAAILTCLAGPVPGDTFRPPYCGPRHPLFRASDMHLELLSRFPRPPGTADLAVYERVFQRPWLDHEEFSWASRWMHPSENMPDHGTAMAGAATQAWILLMADFPLEEKERLLVYFVQWGLDVWGMAQEAGPARGWEAIGGYGDGRKWPMKFAGLMFQDQRILAVQAVFGEDRWTGELKAGAPVAIQKVTRGE